MTDNQLQGVDSLIAKLEGISTEMKYKGGRAGLRKAANLIRDAAKSSANRFDDPKTREDIAKNVTVRFSTREFKRTGDLKFRVGVLGGAKSVAKSVGEVKGKGKENPGGDTFYWRFLEFGTSKIQAQPFLRPALENNVQTAIDTFARETIKSIDRAIKKAAK